MEWKSLENAFFGKNPFEAPENEFTNTYYSAAMGEANRQRQEAEYLRAISDKIEPYDNVAKPKHYMLFEDKGIEVRHVLERLVDKIDASYVDFSIFQISDYVQMMQYGMRFMDKGGIEDLKKMRWYLDKLIA